MEDVLPDCIALDASASTTCKASATLTAPRVTTRLLQSQADYFALLKANPAVRRKLLAICPVNDTVYLVVGTMSARVARFERSAFGAVAPAGESSFRWRRRPARRQRLLSLL